MGAAAAREAASPPQIAREAFPRGPFISHATSPVKSALQKVVRFEQYRVPRFQFSSLFDEDDREVERFCHY